MVSSMFTACLLHVIVIWYSMLTEVYCTFTIFYFVVEVSVYSKRCRCVVGGVFVYMRCLCILELSMYTGREHAITEMPSKASQWSPGKQLYNWLALREVHKSVAQSCFLRLPRFSLSFSDDFLGFPRRFTYP